MEYDFPVFHPGKVHRHPFLVVKHGKESVMPFFPLSGMDDSIPAVHVFFCHVFDERIAEYIRHVFLVLEHPA